MALPERLPAAGAAIRLRSPSPSTVVDVAAVGLHGEHDAGAHRLAVEEHRAGAADAVLAADVRAGQTQLVPQEVAEQKARLDGRARRRWPLTVTAMGCTGRLYDPAQTFARP